MQASLWNNSTRTPTVILPVNARSEQTVNSGAFLSDNQNVERRCLAPIVQEFSSSCLINA
jgi:hypothetical protein